MDDYFLEFLEAISQKKLNLHHIVIYQNDVLQKKYSWVPNDRRVEIHSASKSVTALAAGIAMEEGLFTMDTRPMDVLSKHLPEKYPANLEKVQVRHLITMSIGRDHFLMPGFSTNPNVVTRDKIEDEDWIHYIFGQDIPFEPGTRFMYDTSAWYLISSMITELTGQTMVQWLRPRLFTPLGIRNPQWLMCPQGRNVGAGGLLLNCDELSRLGRVCLNNGRWEDKQLVPEAFMIEAKKLHMIANPPRAEKTKPGDFYPRYSYGYGLWQFYNDNIYFMSGWAGQSCIMIPDINACIAIMSREFNGDEILKTVYDKLILPMRKQSPARAETAPSGEVSPWG